MTTISFYKSKGLAKVILDPKDKLSVTERQFITEKIISKYKPNLIIKRQGFGGTAPAITPFLL